MMPQVRHKALSKWMITKGKVMNGFAPEANALSS
jgi:hypothetical protein